ncbi:hypothetical protein ACS0TY_030098 [Phlomoides rotata]
MKSRMSSIWRPNHGVFVKDIGEGRFIFQFFHHLDLKRVLDGSLWAFGNFPLIIRQLGLGDHPMAVPLASTNFWIQVYHLPMGYIAENIGRMLGNMIGSFLDYDVTNKSSMWRNYMRIRVVVDAAKPLMR